MIFTTWPFLVFMTFVFVCYWWLVPAGWRRAFLLLMSLAYFTYSYPPYALLLGSMTVIVWGIGSLLFDLKERDAPPGQQKAVLGMGLFLCIGVLVLFKYTRMMALTWNGFAKNYEMGSSINVPHFLIPLGISFFTFEFIHYLVDVYLGKVGRKASLLDFSLFAFFFPSLVSGPVKRFQIFQQQGMEVEGFQVSYVAEGLRRIVLGIAKKLIVADTAGQFTVPLEAPFLYARPMIWFAMYAYAVKIYYDFSGYTDIAIGCAQLLGYRLPENFEGPYRQPNIQKFWNKWHMSLSSWIRDYIYFPLGGSKVGEIRVLLNLIIVMTVCGLWHGANWNFVVWGIWNGLGLAGLRVFQKTGRAMKDTLAVRIVSTALTIQFVCFGWVFFAAPSLPLALDALHRMF